MSHSRVPDALQRETLLRRAGIQTTAVLTDLQRITSCCATSGAREL